MSYISHIFWYIVIYQLVLICGKAAPIIVYSSVVSGMVGTLGENGKSGDVLRSYLTTLLMATGDKFKMASEID